MLLRRETVHHGEGGEANRRWDWQSGNREDRKWGQAKQPQDPLLMAHFLSEALQVDRPQLELLPGISIWGNQNLRVQATSQGHLNPE